MRCFEQKRGGLGFTLIEIMIVVSIMAIIMAMAIPFAYRFLHKEGMVKAVSEVFEVCENARRQAIMSGKPSSVLFHPGTGRFEVSSIAAPSADTNGFAGVDDPAPKHETAPTLDPNSGLTGQFSETIFIEMLDVNLTEHKEDEEVRVRFYPNGTCDELTLILRSDKNEWRKISLEVTTALASVESDPNKWR